MEGLAKGVEIMDGLISRAAAIEYLMTNMGWQDENGYAVDDADKKRAIITDLVNGIPTVDAVPVVHGEWKTDGDVMWCSVCKMPVAKTRITGATGRTHFIHIKTKYCSNCGARNMEELKWGT